MTSQINPNNIDGTYPIAGVPNNTQGMRDNFTATKTNFQYAETEINDLQNNGIFKAALTGTTLDNNMANNLIYNARVQGFSGTLIQIANTSGSISVDCSAGHYQTIVMAGNISISFTTASWPAAGTVGLLRLQVTVDMAGRTMTLPAQVSLGTTGIQGYSANVITFAAAGVYEFGFLTYDQGTTITLFDLNRPLSYFTNDVTMDGNLTVSGDIFGNVTLTDISVGTVTATGNVIGGNVKTAGIVSATGNITGGNLISNGIISATGNITGGNVLGGANVNATTHTGTTVSVTGNVNGGNIISAALVQGATLSATGAVTFSGTTQNISIGASLTSGNITIGGSGSAGTGYIAIGGSIASRTLYIGNGAVGSGNTKTISVGENGAAGSTTNINVGPVTATTAAGTVTFNTATVVAVANTSGTALSVAGNVTGGNVRTGGQVLAQSGTAIPAGGTAGAGFVFSSTSNFGIFFGSGAPTLAAAKGSLYLRSDGSTTNDRMYVNTNGSTTWTAVTTQA